jgi:hypothetical protein
VRNDGDISNIHINGLRVDGGMLMYNA